MDTSRISVLHVLKNAPSDLISSSNAFMACKIAWKKMEMWIQTWKWKTYLILLLHSNHLLANSLDRSALSLSVSWEIVPSIEALIASYIQ